MKVAIHHRKGSFSENWIKYCQANKVDYKVVNCYSNSIIDHISDFDALMWHFSNYNYRDMIMARHVLFTAQQMGKKVFPDFNTSWHFDDKIAQKYLLESVGAPLVPTYVFFDKSEAINFIKTAKYPIVFKLRKGAGSKAVWLVRNVAEAKRFVNKAFGKGIPQMNFVDIFQDRIQKYKADLESFTGVLKGAARIFIKSEYHKMTHKEKGYAYFQEFIPDCTHDTRIIVINNKAFAIRRDNRKNDFRASGSGKIRYDKHLICEHSLKVAFEINKKLFSQCTAMDFVHNNGAPSLVEISYGFVPDGYIHCPGFWDEDLTWHEGEFNPYGWMVEDLLSKTQDVEIQH